jgi:hypothetical protein
VAGLFRQDARLLFNNDSRVEQDPDKGPRVVMEQMLKLS